MYGDGGQSGFDISNTGVRLNKFFTPYSDVNFQSGDPTAWVVVSAPFFASGAPRRPRSTSRRSTTRPSPGTLFVGLDHVWRTKDFGGDQATLEANCPEFITFGGQAGCGDFVPLGDPSGVGGPGTSVT